MWFTDSLFRNKINLLKTFGLTLTACRNTNCSKGTIGLKFYYGLNVKLQRG